jgi:hypothetical protein
MWFCTTENTEQHNEIVDQIMLINFACFMRYDICFYVCVVRQAASGNGARILTQTQTPYDASPLLPISIAMQNENTPKKDPPSRSGPNENRHVVSVAYHRGMCIPDVAISELYRSWDSSNIFMKTITFR